MDETLADLADDLAELQSLASSAHARVVEHETYLQHASDEYVPQTISYMLEHVRDLCTRYEEILADIEKTLACVDEWSPTDVDSLIAHKKEWADLLRALQSSFGAMASAGDWQSPSFDHTHLPQAGVDNGNIKPGNNDYRRDMHSIEQRYGQAFRSAYIDHPLRLPPHVNVTNSGMAAVTAALTLLAGTVQSDDVILVGESSYFQSRWVLEKLFPGHIQYVDEFDTEGILRRAREQKPKIIFLDTLCNAPEIPVLDVRRLVPLVIKTLPRSSTLVLDNTGLATMYQPLTELPLNPLGAGLMVIESLLKYHQFGMDRVTAGVVWSPLDPLREEPFFARMHGGTVAPDVAIHMLPAPNRALLDKRLVRLNRNARILAEYIDAAAREGSKTIAGAVYPGLPSHKGYAYTKDMPFHGGFLTVAFHEPYSSIPNYDRFIASVLEKAKERNLDVVGGTSFGFNSTRISVPARYSDGTAKPFVRIAAGTETTQEIEALGKLFADVVRA